MPKQNITISLDEDLIREAKLLSARKSTSVSKLLGEELERLVRKHEQYEQARRSALADLKKGFRMGGLLKASRDDLHER